MNCMHTIKIYGSNTNIRQNGRTVKYPLESAITALSDVVSFELEVKGIFASLDVQTEKKSFWNGSELHINTAKNSFNPQSVPFNFPAVSTSIESFFGADVLNKRYKWLQISDYKIRPKELLADSVIAVNITSISIADNGDGTKKIDFNIVERG